MFAARRQPAMAGAAPLQRENAAAGNLSGSTGSTRPQVQAPAWFEEAKFIEQGRQHFLALQQHWDANEMDKIGEFFTPQMTQFLQQERLNLGDGFQSTYIDDLQVQLDGLDDNPTATVATLTFIGVAKTSRFDQGEAFSESWRMERAHGDNQPWLIAGMRQNQPTHARRRQLHGYRAAHAANPRDEHGRGLEPALPFDSEIAYPHLPLVAALLVGGEFGQLRHGRL